MTPDEVNNGLPAQKCMHGLEKKGDRYHWTVDSGDYKPAPSAAVSAVAAPSSAPGSISSALKKPPAVTTLLSKREIPSVKLSSEQSTITPTAAKAIPLNGKDLGHDSAAPIVLSSAGTTPARDPEIEIVSTSFTPSHATIEVKREQIEEGERVLGSLLSSTSSAALPSHHHRQTETPSGRASPPPMSRLSPPLVLNSVNHVDTSSTRPGIALPSVAPSRVKPSPSQVR